MKTAGNFIRKNGLEQESNFGKTRIENGFLASNLEKGLKKEIVFVKYIKRFEVQKDTTPNSGELNSGISTLAFSSHPLLTKS